MMKFPYGNADFYDVITEGYVYVDRTGRLPLLEEAGKHLLFLRPRRFGKSLLLSLLENYYDVKKAADFNRLFGHLAIGQHPTARHNQYLVLKWDFSAVSPMGNSQQIQQNLYNYINSRIRAFALYYRTILPEQILINPDDALDSFQSLFTALQSVDHTLYLLIDEYDNFANEVMMSSHRPDRYEALVYGEGCLRALFKVVKSATSGQGLDRAFITGVSPVVMSDITSGHNIAENIYLESDFNDLCGFWEAEVAEALGKVIKHCQFPEAKAEEALRLMRTFYNGYCFCAEGPHNQKLLYNPTLVLYFLKYLQRHCHYPREILDSNFATDRHKIEYVSRLPGGEQVIAGAVDEQHPLSAPQLAQRFGVRDMIEVQEDRTFCVSLLYYLGVLTLGGQTKEGELIVKIPNLVVRALYVERIQRMLLPDVSRNDISRISKALYSAGNIQPLCEFIEQHYFKVFDNRDYRWANELTVKTAFLTLLFNDTFYIMDSEPALNRTYADLTMIIRPDMRQYDLLDILIEFKYVSLDDVGVSGEQVRQMGMDDLKALKAVQARLTEASARLANYRQALDQKYGEDLRLHVYSVVAVGFDRVVWEEEGR